MHVWLVDTTKAVRATTNETTSASCEKWQVRPMNATKWGECWCSWDWGRHRMSDNWISLARTVFDWVPIGTLAVRYVRNYHECSPLGPHCQNKEGKA